MWLHVLWQLGKLDPAAVPLMTLVTPFDCAFPRLVSVTSYLAIALLRTASLGILHSTVNERASGVMSTPLTSLVPTTARYCGGGALSAVLEV